MQIIDQHTPRCFTTRYNGRSNVLQNEVAVNNPIFNPISDNNHLAAELTKSYHTTWDTGATGSVISKRVVDQLGLVPISVTTVYTAAGPTEANVYIVDFILPNHVIFQKVQVTQGDIVNTDILIGMDIIGSGDFSVTLENGKTVFSYRHPSCECIDYVKIVDANEKAKFNQGRNNPCGCGSGLKYKDCHGK